jgi:hypothetical protein
VKAKLLLVSAVIGILFYAACKKDSGPAEFKLDCSSLRSEGTLSKRVALQDSNKILIDVNVTKPGKWTVATKEKGDLIFSGSGEFNSEGVQTITLTGSGTPLESGYLEFTIIHDYYFCNYTFLVAEAPQSLQPKANAGSDLAVILPTNATTISGSGTGVNAAITGYQWNQVAGPTQAILTNPTQSQTQISFSNSGTYQFELLVTDEFGGLGRDTANVFVYTAGMAGSLSYQESFASTRYIQSMVYDDSGRIIRTVPSGSYLFERRMTYANNRISKIDFYVNGIYQFVDTYVYDNSGNVIRIDEKNLQNNTTYVFMDFYYNPDNSLQKRVLLPATSPYVRLYFYTGGNLTGILDNNGTGQFGDTIHLAYDNRVNKFKSVAPQYFYLDLGFDVEYKNLTEALYFSKNYPVSYSGMPVNISAAGPNDKPSEVLVNSQTWWRYVYYP